MRLMARLAAGWLGAAACGALCVVAQEPSTVPTLTVSTHLVQITVIARDSRGAGVGTLRKEDFTVRDEGKARRLSVFELESNGAAPAATATVAPNSFTNRPQSAAVAAQGAGNVTMVLLDALNTVSGSHPMDYEDTPPFVEDHAAAYARLRLLDALAKIDPRERIAVYALGNSLRLLCDFTCDRSQVLAAVKAYDPRSKTLREAVEPGMYQFPEADPGFDRAVNDGNKMMAAQLNQQRGQDTLQSLAVIARHVASIPGRKNLIWLTADLPVPGQAVARLLAPQNIAVYPIDGRGLMPGPPFAVPPGIQAMQEMAYETGGRAYVNTNGIVPAIREVAEDVGARYTLGFYLDEAAVDGKFHELKLHVARPGVVLEAPQGYFAVKDAPRSEGLQAQLLSAIQNPYPVTVIPLDITAARVERRGSRSLQLTGSIGIAGLPMADDKGRKEDTLEVFVVEQGAAGQVLRQSLHHMALALTGAQYETYRKTGVAFRQIVEPLPATAVLRVLVRESESTQMGSVIIPVKQIQ